MPKVLIRSAEIERRSAPAPVVVRPAPAHGLGVFAACDIPAGTRVAEYTGDRISHAEAARRYDDARAEHVHTLLFTVDRTTVIDGATGDGIARYMNHSCEPNCDAFLEDGRVFLETIRPVAATAELTYDYRLRRPQPLPRDWRRRYACRCGAPRCRGTMLVRSPLGNGTRRGRRQPTRSAPSAC